MPGFGKKESTVTGAVAGIRVPAMDMEDDECINFDDSEG
jgi:hypothetical protein